MPQFDALIPEVSLRELQETRDAHLRSRLLRLVASCGVVMDDTASESLAMEYVNRKIVPAEYLNDARQIAVASVSRADYLVSWNFVHMVNEDTRRAVAQTNRAHGYPEIRIVSPLEFGGDPFAV